MTIPASYARLIIDLCAQRGIDLADAAACFDPEALAAPDGRLKLNDVAMLFYEAFRQDDAIGYEIGLNTQFSSHGFVGYGVLTHPTFGEAVEFGVRFANLRTPFVSMRSTMQADSLVIDVEPAFDLGPMTRICLEHFLIGIWSVAKSVAQASGISKVAGELHFQHPRPPCHAQYADRLPLCFFMAPGYQLRLPGVLLATPLATADVSAAKLATAQCEQEAQRQRHLNTVALQVRAALAKVAAPPPLSSVAKELHMSARSLKRKLQAENSSYQSLVDQHREGLARQWLKDSPLSVSDIAEQLGYTTTANFSRAFRRWTGLSPSDMRKQWQPTPRAEVLPNRR